MMVYMVGIALFGFLAFAHYWGLIIAPPDQMMGDVYRILFVHVPAAWNALLLFTISFVAAIVSLLRRSEFADRLSASAIEVGVVLTGLTLALGSIWGKPTWGVWWTWDPRLTTTAILFILYLGYLLVRRLIDHPERRARVTASLAILMYLNVPIVYFSVKWWRSLHQVQSTPQTIAPEMVIPLRLGALAILGIVIFFVVIRVKLAKRTTLLEEREAVPPESGKGGTR